MHPLTTAVTSPPGAGVVAPDGLIDGDEHARWDAIEAEARAARGDAPREVAAPPVGTDYAAVYQTPYAPPPASSRPAGMSYFAGFRSAKGLAAFTQLGLAATALAAAIGLWFVWQARDLLGRIEAGEGALGAEIASSDSRTGAWFVLYLLLFLGTGVVFLAWFHRSYKNTGALNPWDPMRRTSGWAIGAWFVPFLNWVRPVSMANEMWRKSESPHATQPTPATLLWVWWPTWLVGGIGTQVTSDIAGSLEAGVTVELLQFFNTLTMFGLVASLIAAMTCLMLVGSLTERLDRRFVELRTWETTR
ncbi:MAG: DUF4328 domain-containing protein [Acidimicrobiia bacterium]|nr:DUF4328 domain-containing protein [Acidimicrobiia bacterium]